MANRFDRYVSTEYVGMPVDYYQAALMAKETQAEQQVQRQRMQLQAYGQITPIGADAKALQRQLFDRIKGQISGVVKKDLRTQDALNSLHNIVNDPETMMASRNFLQDIGEYTKANKDYEEYVKANPNDVNALPYLKAQFNLAQQKGEANKYKQGAFSNIGPFTKYYDWKKLYNEIAAKVGKSGSTVDTPMPGNYIWTHSQEGKPRDQIHEAVMQQLSSDSDAMQQIQRELEYNAFRSNPNDPNKYFQNVRVGDVANAKAQFDEVMQLKADLNNPQMDAEMRKRFRQQYIAAGKPVPDKKTFNAEFGKARLKTIKDANKAVTDIQNQVLTIRNTDPRTYATNKYVENAVSGIADTYATNITKDLLKADMARINADNLAFKKNKWATQLKMFETAMAGDSNIRIGQGNVMPKGEPVTSWNDPVIFKGTPLENVDDTGKVQPVLPSYSWTKEWFGDAKFEEQKRQDKQIAEGQTYDKTIKAAQYVESQYGEVLGAAPVAPDPIMGSVASKQAYLTNVQNYLARGKKLAGDIRYNNQQVAPMVFHLDPLSGSNGQPAPINKVVSETLDLSEHIYTEGSTKDEKTELMAAKNYKVGDKEGLSLRDAIAASNGISMITDSKFGFPAIRYELQTTDGPQTVYIEQRPDKGGPISKIMQSYGITGMAHSNTPGSKWVNINTPEGPKSVVVETMPPMKAGKQGPIYDPSAAGMQNQIYEDPNHPTLVQYADKAMKDLGITNKSIFISAVNNAYKQYTEGNADYKLDPKTNLIHGPNGLVMPPMKYVRVNNEGVEGLNRYVLVAPQPLLIGKGVIGGTPRTMLDFEKQAVQNAIGDPAYQHYRRYPRARPKTVNQGFFNSIFSPGYDYDEMPLQDEPVPQEVPEEEDVP